MSYRIAVEIDGIKMDQSVLMIGNYVTDEWNSSIIKVESINDKGINLKIEDDGNYAELAQTWIAPDYKFESLRGIPITKDILMKIECIEKREHEKDSYIINSSLILTYIDDDWIEYVTQRKINYLHELQNFWFWSRQSTLIINL